MGQLIQVSDGVDKILSKAWNQIATKLAT